MVTFIFSIGHWGPSSELMLKERVIRYKGKDILVTFHVDRCTHYAACIRGAPGVFDAQRRPWIDPDAEPADTVARVIEKCPTGALHYRRSDGGPEESIPRQNVIEIARMGPYYISGDLEIRNQAGDVMIRDTRLALCRCGQSKHKPLCDGEHQRTGPWDKGSFPRTKEDVPDPSTEAGKLIVTVSDRGSCTVNGPMIIIDEAKHIKFQGTVAALCSCGLSQNKPFCDGSHIQIPQSDDR